MLTSLHIENVAVIKNADIDLKGKFTVLTGETGAGKSIIIDSVNLLLGAKASSELVRNGEKKALVCGMFEHLSAYVISELAELGIAPDEDGVIYVTREIGDDGRSGVKINGRSYPVSMLRSIGSLLINIHGQHDNQKLLDEKQHIDILDNYAGIESEKSEYRKLYLSLKELDKKIEDILSNESERERKKDLLEYQIKEIESAALFVGEEEKLKKRKELISNNKQLIKHATNVYRALYKNDKGISCDRLIEIAMASLSQMSEFLPEFKDCEEQLAELQSKIKEISEAALCAIPSDISDPQKELEEINDRLYVIQKLCKKYGGSEQDIIDFCENAKAELSKIENSESNLLRYKKERAELWVRTYDHAEKLHAIRVNAASRLTENICSELLFLDMPNVRFAVCCELKDDESGLVLTSNGADSIVFRISANAGEEMRSISKIASGGELSRIMLAIKCVLNEAENIPTVIFDEVDTGISGKTSQKIGIKLHSLGKTTQVMCVTHSAQIAALADNHLKISKAESDGRTYTEVKELSYDERVNEIARIMGGITISDNILNSAKEMLNNIYS